MRASLAMVLFLGVALMLSPASAQTPGTPLPPDSQAHTVATASLLELLLALRLGSPAPPAEAPPATARPQRSRHAAAPAQLAVAAGQPAPPPLTPP